jgi:hypothetical protein
MKKTVFAIAASAVLAVAAYAADLKSGLKPGERVPAFQVVDVNGPHKGEQLCYRCNYGGAPVAAAFIKGNAPEAGLIVSGLQKLVEENKGLRTFVVFMGGPELKSEIQKLAAEKKITVPLTFLPQGPSAEDIVAYQINPKASSTVLLWNKQAVQSSFVNVNEARWADVSKAAAAMAK